MLKGHAFVTALLTAALVGCSLLPRPVPLGRNCAEWSRLDADQQLQTAEALIAPERMTSVREKQHLPPDSADPEVFAAVGSSLGKVCDLERQPDLVLAEIVTSLHDD